MGGEEGKSALEVVTLGGGCFWCVEAVFLEVRGVERVVSGYAGGDGANPTYQQVCSGATGHAEVVQVHFDPEVVSTKEILGIFFATHDPTTLNQQGGDIGTQYRSVVFYGTPQQRETVEEVIADLDARQIFQWPIVTEVAPLEMFYPAEAYHQEYYPQNPQQGYCRAVIDPKMAKFRASFLDKLKRT